MRFTHINRDKMKQSNLQYVLHTIRRNEPISRKSLSELVGLTPSSITNIVNSLLAEHYLIEAGAGKSTAGRKPILLELNSNVRYAVGVELNTAEIICIITDFKSQKIIKSECPTLMYRPRDAVIGRIVDLINRTITEAGVAREKIMGIGLVSAGPYNHEQGLMVNPPNFPGWFNVPIREMVEEATGIPTYFEKETVGAALGEFWFGEAASVSSIFAVNVYNVGIGGGVIIDGRVYHGFSDGAGDLGHMVVEPEGPLCSCGDRGCLETMASGTAIVREVCSGMERGEDSLLTGLDPAQINIEKVIKAAEVGDRMVIRVIKRSARYLGIALSNLINVYSPEMIVIGGKIAKECPYYLDTAIQQARSPDYPLYNQDVALIPSTFGKEQGAMGGIGLVFQEFFRQFEVE